MAYDIWMDGFDHYANFTELAQGYPLGNLGSSYGWLETSLGRRRGQCLATRITSLGFGRLLAQAFTWATIGMAVYPGNANARHRLWALRSGTGNFQCVLIMEAGQVLKFYGAALRGTATAPLVVGAWNWVEFRVLIGNSGSIECQVNGATVIPYTACDTTSSSDTTAQQFWIGSDLYYDNLDGNYSRIDDVVVQYGDTAPPFLGDTRVDAYALTANSTPQDLTPDSGTAYDRLNSDNANGYIASATTGHRSLFTVANLAHNPTTIHGAQITGVARKDNTGSRSVILTSKSSSTVTEHTAEGLSETFYYYHAAERLNPATSAAWDKAALDALEIGVTVGA